MSWFAWLKSPEGTAALGLFAYMLVSVVARYAPRTPGWNAVRSFAADYAQKNLTTLPPELAVRIDPESAEVVLLIGEREVRRVPMVRVSAEVSR